MSDRENVYLDNTEILKRTDRYWQGINMRKKLEELKRPVRRISDGYDTCEDPYDVGWNNALNKVALELLGGT